MINNQISIIKEIIETVLFWNLVIGYYLFVWKLIFGIWLFGFHYMEMRRIYEAAVTEGTLARF
jgi:L-lysine 2,3-aminomutase